MLRTDAVSMKGCLRRSCYGGHDKPKASLLKTHRIATMRRLRRTSGANCLAGTLVILSALLRLGSHGSQPRKNPNMKGVPSMNLSLHATPTRRHLLAVLGCLIAAASLAHLPALGQTTGNRPIRMIVPFAAGSNTDAVARLIAPGLGERLGATIIG